MLLHVEQRSHRFHPVPQILQAQVLIGSMLIVVGIRFQGSLPIGDVETLEAMVSPAEYGEQKRSASLGKNWIVQTSDMAVSLRSPFGAIFELGLLEE